MHSTAHFIFLALLSVCSLACFGNTTKVEKTTWQKREAYRLSNDKAEAIIVPAWRRVMHYGRVGGPNLLWNGDVSVPPTKAPTFVNYGGEKAWVWPQGEWRDRNGKRSPWPPPNDDSSSPPLEVVRIDDGSLVLRDALETFGDLAMTRTYTLLEDGSLAIDSVLRDHLAEPRSYAAWSIVQLPRAKRIVAELDGPDAKIQPLTGQPSYRKSDDGKEAVIDTHAEKDVKLGLDASRLRAEYDGYTVTLAIDPAQSSPGRYVAGEKAQVYVTSVESKDSYIELEFISARVDDARQRHFRVVLSIDDK